MGLCGRSCGCAIVDGVETGGVVGGFPAIVRAIGIGRPGSAPYQFEMDQDWAEAVVAAMNTWTGTEWTATAGGENVIQGTGLGMSLTSRYQLSGVNNKIVHHQFTYNIGSPGTAGQPITFNLPFTSTFGSPLTIGAASVFDVSANVRYSCAVELQSTTVGLFVTDTSSTGALGASPALTLAAGDIIRGSIMYERT